MKSLKSLMLLTTLTSVLFTIASANAQDSRDLDSEFCGRAQEHRFTPGQRVIGSGDILDTSTAETYQGYSFMTNPNPKHVIGKVLESKGRGQEVTIQYDNGQVHQSEAYNTLPSVQCADTQRFINSHKKNGGCLKQKDLKRFCRGNRISQNVSAKMDVVELRYGTVKEIFDDGCQNIRLSVEWETAPAGHTLSSIERETFFFQGIDVVK